MRRNLKKGEKEIYNLQPFPVPSPVKCVIKVLVILYDRFPLTPETENAGLLSFIVPPSDNKETRNILKQSSSQRTGPGEGADRTFGSFVLTDFNFSLQQTSC